MPEFFGEWKQGNLQLFTDQERGTVVLRAALPTAPGISSGFEIEIDPERAMEFAAKIVDAAISVQNYEEGVELQ